MVIVYILFGISVTAAAFISVAMILAFIGRKLGFSIEIETPFDESIDFFEYVEKKVERFTKMGKYEKIIYTNRMAGQNASKKEKMFELLNKMDEDT